MNMKQMKSMISKFRSADLSLVKDADMRAKAEKLQAKQGGFTLLELLVVVAILAIIAGAVISSLDGQEELAAQKTTVHTMAAMEEGFQVYRVTANRTLPGGMDSLICSDAADASAGTVTLAGYQGGTNAILGGISNVARVGGGLTADLGGELAIVDVPNATAQRLVDNGLTSIRVADATFCDATANNGSGGIEDTALVDVVKPNLFFQDALVEGGEYEFGAGVELDLSGYADTSAAIPVALLEEAEEITRNEFDVVGVFGVGPGSEIVGDIIARAPSDGNGGPDKYSNFSAAVRIATCDYDPATEEYETQCIDTTANWQNADIEVVAILDAGGDAYDDEVAEARGNQEE